MKSSQRPELYFKPSNCDIFKLLEKQKKKNNDNQSFKQIYTFYLTNNHETITIKKEAYKGNKNEKKKTSSSEKANK